jgi:hypothetical protein
MCCEFWSFKHTFIFILHTWFCRSIGVVTQLINELDNWFPQCASLDAMRIIYPQYWPQLEGDASLPNIKNVERVAL